MIRYVLLDLDDTILDFKRSEAEGLRKTLRQFGIEPTDAIVARYSVINDAQWKLLELGKLTRFEVKRRRFTILFDELGVACDADAVWRCYEKALSENHFFFEGAEEFLSCMEGKNRMYIVSNGTTSVQNGRIASAGIAHYFNIDPTLIRLAWVIFTLAGGCGLIAYVIAAIIMPREV